MATLGFFQKLKSNFHQIKKKDEFTIEWERIMQNEGPHIYIFHKFITNLTNITIKKLL